MEEQQVLRIICLQTCLTEYHYQSYPILKQYFLERIRHSIKSQMSINNLPINEMRAKCPTLVILPECTGTWLYLMCVPMPRSLRNYFFSDTNKTYNRHILFILYTLVTHIRLFFKQIRQNYHSKLTWLGLIKRSWFGLFADQTTFIYKKLFGELAYETNCTIVAGSNFMYESADRKYFYNMSYVFEPTNGSICLQSGKQYPVLEEASFIDSYENQQPIIYSIPNTNIDISVLICADSWMPQVYEKYNKIEFNSNRRFLFIVVALNTDQWNIIWPGYDNSVDIPEDVDKTHIKTYTLSEAWFHYAVNRGFNILAKRHDLVGYGIVCCQGILNIMNDIQAQGESMILLKRSKLETKVLYKAETFHNEKILNCEF